ncbi:MAG: hypothetical protein Fur0010_07010 [Bdellovibrio sp.]
MLHRVIIAVLIFTSQAHAVPIDWNGAFGVDLNVIKNYRRVESGVDNSALGSNGSQEVPLGSGGQPSAKFQTYVFKLQPVILVNDSAQVKGEFTTGYGRGGRLGDASVDSFEGSQGGTTTNTYGNILYPYAFSGSNALNVKQLYMDLFADTATYTIGRHSAHYGLGALVNSGDNLWDRHFSMRDGITIKLKLGNFNISPYYSKVSSKSTLTGATQVRESGFSLLYDNPDREIAFGILYGTKKSSANETSVQSSTSGSSTSIGAAEVKMTDIYFQKTFGIFSFAAEVPILSGDIGTLYGADTKYKAKAILFESWLNLNNSWKFGLDAGQVTGEDNSQSSFDAMYLHPNYQIANLLFKYNMRSISSPLSVSLYDSYVHNVNYLKFKTKYSAEKWVWDFAIIYAKAAETAQAGSTSFNHTTNKTFTANSTQSDDLGTEVDLSFNYLWNNDVTIGGDLGYLFTGDYFSFTNDNTVINSAKNTYLLQLKAGIKF